MKTRNPNANCGNCPYVVRNQYYKKKGECRIDPKGRSSVEDYPEVFLDEWCGQHPDFWAEEEAPRHDTEEWFPADYAPPKWETVICDNGKEIYAGFRSEAVWYRLGSNGTYPYAAPQRWKPLQALVETDGRKENEE